MRFGSFSKSNPLAVNLDVAARSTIASLFFSICPGAVVGLIVTVVVNAMNCVAFAGPVADVGQKVGEACSPAVTNDNAAPAVVGKFRIVRVCASLNHSGPGLVFGRSLTVFYGMPVREPGIAGSKEPLQGASTAIGVPGFNRRAPSCKFFAAPTAANPESGPFWTRIAVRKSQKSYPVNFDAGKVFWFWSHEVILGNADRKTTFTRAEWS